MSLERARRFPITDIFGKAYVLAPTPRPPQNCSLFSALETNRNYQTFHLVDLSFFAQMSFFRGNQPTPPPPGTYSRVPEGGYNNSLPSAPRGAGRPMPPPYNDPSAALFDRRPIDRKAPPPRSGGRCVVTRAVLKHLTDTVFDSQLWCSIIAE